MSNIFAIGSRGSFRRELLISMVGVLASAAFISAVLVTVLTYDRTTALARHQAEQFVVSTAPETSYALLVGREDKRAAEASLRTITQRPDIEYAELSDDTGRRVAALGRTDLTANATALKDLRARSVRSAFTAGHWHAVAPVFVESSVAFDAPAQRSLVGYLYVVVSPAPFASLYKSILLAIIAGAVVALTFGLLWTLIRTRRLTQPLIDLTRSMESASVDVSLRASGNGPAEMERMARAFNKLMQRLADHQTSLQQIVDEQTSELRSANLELQTAIIDAKQAERFKDGVLAAVSHEMKTPLHSIDASLREALHELEFLHESDEADRIRRHILMALGQKERLLILINQILDYARARAGRHSVRIAVVHAGDLLQSLRHLFQALAKKNNNSLELRHEGIKVFSTDSEKLQTIAVNLLSNACKYTHDGSITVSLLVTENITLVVEDTGCGIDSQSLDTVWDAFRQCEMGENRAVSGTGLGLTVTKAFVELLEGKIELLSARGKGTRVTVEIPAHVPPRATVNLKETTDANV